MAAKRLYLPPSAGVWEQLDIALYGVAWKQITAKHLRKIGAARPPSAKPLIPQEK